MPCILLHKTMIVQTAFLLLLSLSPCAFSTTFFSSFFSFFCCSFKICGMQRWTEYIYFFWTCDMRQQKIIYIFFKKTYKIILCLKSNSFFVCIVCIDHLRMKNSFLSFCLSLHALLHLGIVEAEQPARKMKKNLFVLFFDNCKIWRLNFLEDVRP